MLKSSAIFTIPLNYWRLPMTKTCSTCRWAEKVHDKKYANCGLSLVVGVLLGIPKSCKHWQPKEEKGQESIAYPS